MKSLHRTSMLRNILKFGLNMYPKMYETSPSKTMKTTNLRKAVGAPALSRHAFMFAFNLKSMFWGIMFRMDNVDNGTTVLSLLFLVSPYASHSG